ncbi:hypothetical protein HY489_03750 [Candidatus Woesearchaeota archaeon]|nr:hypothetical protein [Candidatus Woesearchaeota archaeon]
MESDRLLLSVAVVVAIITVLLLGRPTITGYVPTQTRSQNLDIDITQSQRYTLSHPTNGLKLGSLALSGTVKGEGVASITLTDGTDTWLVYTNTKKVASAMKHITGLATTEIILQPGETLPTTPNLPEGYLAEPGNFDKVCIETCTLDPTLFNKKSLYLDFSVQQGTTIHINEITFTTVE